jgi:hypothetical protein
MTLRGGTVFLALLTSLSAQTFHNYVGQAGPRSVLLAWGVTGGAGNTIGLDSVPLGNATVRIANRTIPASHNWVSVDGLSPDTTYPYEIDIDGSRRGGGQVRTWPEEATRLCFFVLGDYGNASSGQYRVAKKMTEEFRTHAGSGCPIRFVLTVGDNIYGNANLGAVELRSGDHDSDWDSKFFRPYQEILRQVPFLPTLGNHDGNGSENRADLFVYLDNFFFPGNHPARWYTFTYGGLAQFFALDSTTNSEIGPPAPAYDPAGAESKWLQLTMKDATAPWKIPYFHHPVYNAGPRHGASYNDLKHWVSLFEESGVKVVFSGHEHNVQFSKPSETGGILYVVSGSGGELRRGDIRPAMDARHIAVWAASRAFLAVEINGSEMRITPVSPDNLRPVDPDGHPVRMPVLQRLK